MKLQLDPSPVNLGCRLPMNKFTAMEKKRILLVDDDAGVRESLAAALRSDGFLVFHAKNGPEALELFSTTKIDLVLLDLNMPVMGGWDAFERLTSQNPLIPIIIITARPNQLFTALSAGVGALLEKPIDLPDLVQAVNKLLAEPGEARLARLTGHRKDFHYYSPSPDRHAVDNSS